MEKCNASPPTGQPPPVRDMGGKERKEGILGVISLNAGMETTDLDGWARMLRHFRTIECSPYG
jgi:hypothetical protein